MAAEQVDDSSVTAEQKDAQVEKLSKSQRFIMQFYFVQVLVEDLYTYNQQYYLDNDVSDPSMKDADIKIKMEDCVGKLKEMEGILYNNQVNS